MERDCLDRLDTVRVVNARGFEEVTLVATALGVMLTYWWFYCNGETSINRPKLIVVWHSSFLII